MKRMIFIASLIGGLMLLAGCRKEFGRGGEIRFVASSVAGPRTRTEYSGEGNRDSNGLLTWERIDWKNGDLIRIWSDAAKTPAGDVYSDYKVSSVKEKSGDPTRSQASVENAKPNGLTWDGVESACGFWAVYPASMAGTGTTRTVNLTIADSQTSSDGLASAPMVAAVDNATPGDPVTLEFYPAFTAFEITLKSKDQDITLNSFALTSASKALSGTFTSTIAAGGTSTFACPSRTDATGKVKYTFDSGTVITNAENGGVTFTVLALPQAYDDLTLEFSVTVDGVAQTRKLALSKADGSSYLFAACSKHRIYGLAMPGNAWNFKYISIENEVIEWTDVPVSGLDTDDLPEATQFVVNGANNGRYYTSGDQTSPVAGRDATTYRQYWLMKSGTPTTVTFKIMAPEGGTYEVVPQGDVDKFTIEGSLSGNINSKPSDSSAPSKTTVVSLSITSTTTTEDAVLYFKTYVSKGGIKYSIDSETQLYDVRGYHYFVMNNRTTVQ